MITDELYNVLTRPERLEDQIKRKKREIERMERAVYPSGIRYDRDKVQTSPRDDQIPSVLAETEPLKEDLANLLKRYQEAETFRSRLLDSIDPEAAKIISARYTRHQKWDEMKREFHYSERQLRRICDRGTNKLESAMILSHFSKDVRFCRF